MAIIMVFCSWKFGKERQKMAKICNSELTAQRQYDLQNGLLQLMRVMPYEKITVSGICEKASIPRRTFYRYFECKEDVLKWTLNNLLEEFYLQVLFDFRMEPSAVRESLVRFFGFWYQEENRWKLECLLENGLEMQLVACSMQKKSNELAVICSSQDDRLERLTISAIMGTTAFFSVLFYWCRDKFRQNPEQMADHTAHYLTSPLFSLQR